MRIPRPACLFIALGVGALALTGCGHDHSTDASEGHHEGHEHAEESKGGARFDPGKGVILSAETRQSLGVKTAEVEMRKIPLEVRFSAQVFGENHKPTAAETYHADCTAKAAGLLPEDTAAHVRPGAFARLKTNWGESFGGVVLGLNKALAIGDVEVLVGATNSGAHINPGDFLSATIVIPPGKAVFGVPESAVLRTAEGSFVYTMNGDAYHRTAVKTGAEGEGFIEITDGLLSGDIAVTTPVEKLWLIELRATKGGGHSH